MISIFVRHRFKSIFRLCIDHTLIVMIVVLASLNGCKSDIKTDKKEVFYTCSMHPLIMETNKGNCAVCGMELIPMQKNLAQNADEVRLSDQQIILGNIHIDTIVEASLKSETLLPATLNYDQQKLAAVSSRVMGRVELLYHKNIGDFIRKGDPLMEIYSEELNSAKQQYLLALERAPIFDSSSIHFNQVILSAKTKLLLWGMTEWQVGEMAKNNRATLTTTVYSSQSGYITEVTAQEGAYLNEGGTIVQLADLSTVWAEAQLYTSQVPEFNNKSAITVQLPEINKRLLGHAEFVNPEISPDKRINLLRVTIPNPDNQLKPGMVAYVIIEGGKGNAISLPVDAVIRDSKGASVWVETGKNIFKNKLVTIGIESGNRVEIKAGLVPGEVVVTRGAYLINSEYIFTNGRAPMAGMKM